MTINKNTGYLVKPTNPRINSATPTDLIFSTAQDILITRGYQINSNPLGLTPLLMSVAVLHTFGVTISSEPSGYSLIQKSTSHRAIDNPAIIDPGVALLKPGLATAKEIGITLDTDDPLFKQDVQLTYSQEQIFIKNRKSTLPYINLSPIAKKFCAPALSAGGAKNMYFINMENSTRTNISGKGTPLNKSKGKIL